MDDRLVTLHIDQHNVAWVTLARPQRHNALVPALLSGLRTALAQARDAVPVALVLQASGTSFSTGGDLAGFAAVNGAAREQYAENLVGLLHASILDLLRLPCPTVAAVQGPVTGGSVGLVLACDLAVASQTATLAPWYTRVGLSPDGGWTVLMPERIGRARALALQLTNTTLSAEEAHHLGLYSHLADFDRFAPVLDSVLETLKAAKAGSVAHTLALLRPDTAQVAEGLAQEASCFLQQINTREADQGMAEFLDASGACRHTGVKHGNV